MAKPWHPYNRLDIPEVEREGGKRAVAAETEAEEREGKQRDEAVDPPPPPTQNDGSNPGAPRGHRNRGRCRG